MSAPALALAPVLTGAGTGTGVNTGLVSRAGHRYHALRENTDGKQESRGAGRFAGPRDWPGAPRFPLSILPAARQPGGWA